MGYGSTRSSKVFPNSLRPYRIRKRPRFAAMQPLLRALHSVRGSRKVKRRSTAGLSKAGGGEARADSSERLERFRQLMAAESDDDGECFVTAPELILGVGEVEVGNWNSTKGSAALEIVLGFSRR